MSKLAERLARWRHDTVAFVEEAPLIDPETKRPYKVLPAHAQFLREADRLTADGRLFYPEQALGAPKKSAKTTVASWKSIKEAISVPYAEVYILANDYEQSVARVFTQCARIIEASPLLRDTAKITNDRIEFVSTGSFIKAVASDYAGFAGGNPSLCVFDELWAYVSERSRRLFDEAVPSPVRKISARLTVTYAGFSGESKLLEELYKRGIQGQEIAPSLFSQPGLLRAWHHLPIAPWQDENWLSQMRVQLRPNAYLRLIENRFVTSEAGFVDMADYDQCVDPDARPALGDPNLRVFIGLDGSYSHDSTAIAVVAFDAKEQKVRLIAHRTFTPTKDEPVNFADVENELLRLRRAFAVQAVMFDPYQLVALSQRMTALGLPMEPFTQSSSNLEAASTNLGELIRHHNLVAYPDSEVRLALSRTVAIETPRGLRISKAKQSHRIDIIAALSFAAFAAVRGGQHGGLHMDHDFQQHAAQVLHAAAQRHQQKSYSNRLEARGEDFSAAEDRSALLARSSHRRKWRGA